LSGYLNITVKLVCKGHSMEPENVVFMSRCSLYTGQNETALYRQCFVI